MHASNSSSSQHYTNQEPSPPPPYNHSAAASVTQAIQLSTTGRTQVSSPHSDTDDNLTPRQDPQGEESKLHESPTSVSGSHIVSQTSQQQQLSYSNNQSALGSYPQLYRQQNVGEESISVRHKVQSHSVPIQSNQYIQHTAHTTQSRSLDSTQSRCSQQDNTSSHSLPNHKQTAPSYRPPPGYYTPAVVGGVSGVLNTAMQLQDKQTVIPPISHMSNGASSNSAVGNKLPRNGSNQNIAFNQAHEPALPPPPEYPGNRGDVRRSYEVLDRPTTNGASPPSVSVAPVSVTTDYDSAGIRPSLSHPELTSHLQNVTNQHSHTQAQHPPQHTQVQHLPQQQSLPHMGQSSNTHVHHAHASQHQQHTHQHAQQYTQQHAQQLQHYTQHSHQQQQAQQVIYRTADQQQDFAAVAARASKMVEVLSGENKSLRTELECYYKKVSKLQKIEYELQKVHEAYECLVKSCLKKESIEKAYRIKQEMEIKQLEESSRQYLERAAALESRLAEQNSSLVDQQKTVNKQEEIIENLTKLTLEQKDTISYNRNKITDLSTELEQGKTQCRTYEEELLAYKSDASTTLEEESEVKMAALTQSTKDSERIISEAQAEKLRYMDEAHQAARKVANLEAKLKSLEASCAEKDAIVRVLQRRQRSNLSGRGQATPLNQGAHARRISEPLTSGAQKSNSSLNDLGTEQQTFISSDNVQTQTWQV